MSQVQETLDTINELNIWAKWGIGVTLTLIALGITRLVLKKVILERAQNAEIHTKTIETQLTFEQT